MRECCWLGSGRYDETSGNRGGAVLPRGDGWQWFLNDEGRPKSNPHSACATGRYRGVERVVSESRHSAIHVCPRLRRFGQSFVFLDSPLPVLRLMPLMPGDCSELAPFIDELPKYYSCSNEAVQGLYEGEIAVDEARASFESGSRKFLLSDIK